MPWHEAWLLTTELASDPTSHVGAALASLAHPIDATTVVLADLWDLLLAVNTKKGASQPKPYPRSWLPRRRTQRAALPQETIRAALRARGHDV